MTPEQQQYACDLVNQSRTDAAVCKVGKPCKGRCIPKDHECQSDGTGRKSNGEDEYETYSETHGYQYEPTPQGRAKMNKQIREGNLKALGGAAVLVGGVGILAAANADRKRKAEAKESAEFDKKYAEHLERANAKIKFNQEQEARREELSKKVETAGAEISENFKAGLKAKAASMKQESRAKDEAQRQKEAENDDFQLRYLRKTHAENEGYVRYMSAKGLKGHREMGERLKQLEQKVKDRNSKA